MEKFVEYQVPFCRPFVCSPNSQNETSTSGNQVLWNCLPDDCKVSVLVFVGVIVMLAAMTITFNCLILGINLASKTRRMRKRNPTMSNYSIYVVSLAVADLLVGVVVLPLCIVNFYLEFMVDGISYAAEVERVYLEEKTLAWSESNEAVEARMIEISGNGTPVFNTTVPGIVKIVRDQPMAAQIVRGALGVFTHLTLFVSIYTLITASADRFYAASYLVRFSSSQISKSARNQTKTGCLRHAVVSVRRSTIAVCIVWVVGVVFALVPILVNGDLHFRHVGHIFAAMTSNKHYSSAVRWYLSTLVIPLIGMWALNLMICFTLWRRKIQLGLRRRRSLRGNHSSEQRRKQPPPSPCITSNSDSVFDAQEGIPVPKYPASRWNKSNSTDGLDTKVHLTTPHALYRNKPGNSSTGPPKSPTSLQSQSTQWESRGSVLRRKVSSIRRAKEMLRRQSYETNITKTLCIVVLAFTLAVLPLVVSLSQITVEEDSSKETLNREVSVVTCSLLLLFSNSLVNCVIYGARMRDFRATLCQLLRGFADKIKNAFCCCCAESSDGFSSEVVSGVFLLTKHSRSDAFQRSPRLRGTHSVDRFKFLSRSVRKSHNSREAPSERESDPDNAGAASPIPRISFYPVNCDGPASYENRDARPSSSGYRTDPDAQSTQGDAQRKRSSQTCDEEGGKDGTTSFAAADDSSTKTTIGSTTVLVTNEGEKGVSSSLCLTNTHPRNEQLEVETRTKQEKETVTMSRETDDKVAHSNVLQNGGADAVIMLDEDNDSRDSEHSNNSMINFTLNIDFSQFSTT